jgi:hypothetical protein
MLNEKHLHAALKDWYAQPGDQFEVPVDGSVIDIVRGGELIEIQTGNFSSIKRKLLRLIPHHKIRLIYPIADQKWIVKLPKKVGDSESRRKSPKRGEVIDVFKEIVYLPELIPHENFTLEVVLIEEEEIRRYVGGRTAWRKRGWVTEERKLVDVVECHQFATGANLWALISAEIPDQFTTTDLSKRMRIHRRLAQQIAYCFRKMDFIEQIGNRNRSKLYQRKQ